jgi:hypothetical protein
MRKESFAGVTPEKRETGRRSQTVQTATQFRLRREKQQTVSDEAIVVMTFCESRKERRASVIWLEVFWNNPDKGRGRKTKENDKVIAN